MKETDEILLEMLRGHDLALRQLRPPGTRGLKWSSIEGYIVDEGVPFESAELTADEWDVVLVAASASQANQLKECFYNAAMLALHDTTGSLKYVEGAAKMEHLMPVRHAWCTINGKVIDTTWRLKMPTSLPLPSARPGTTQ